MPTITQQLDAEREAFAEWAASVFGTDLTIEQLRFGERVYHEGRRAQRVEDRIAKDHIDRLVEQAGAEARAAHDQYIHEWAGRD